MCIRDRLNSDGEINPITILDDARKGPILVHKNFSVSQSVPFDTEDANVFLNGVASTLSAVRSAQQQAGFAVLYYNVKSKTIWAYTTMGWDKDDDSGNNSYILLKGEIKNIYYKSTDVMTPTSVRIEVDKANSDDSFDSSEDEDSDGYLTISQMCIRDRDTDLTPFDTGAYASRQTYVSGMACKKCAVELRHRILDYAAYMLNHDVTDLSKTIYADQVKEAAQKLRKVLGLLPEDEIKEDMFCLLYTSRCV